MEDFKGKTVVVRGGGNEKSIGHAIACAFADAGADIAVCGSKRSRAVAVVEGLRSRGVEAIALAEPLDGVGHVDEAVRTVIERFGRIDVLVNCALVSKAQLMEHLTSEDLLRAFSMNALVAFEWMKRCREHLAKTNGCVINLCSRLAQQGVPAYGALACASAGIEALSKVAGSEWEEDGVKVHVLEAQSETPRFEELLEEHPELREDVSAAMEGCSRFEPLDAVASRCVRMAAAKSARTHVA